MNKVFISGSRTQELLPKDFIRNIDNMIAKNMVILLGDSNKGVDNSVADYLKISVYKNVEVYGIKKEARFQILENWSFRKVDVPSFEKNEQKKQMIKDRELVLNSDYGLALFDTQLRKNRFGKYSVSSGTLRNVIQLLLNGKVVKFYYGTKENQFACSNLKSIDDLEHIIADMNDTTQKKYRELLKNERKILIETTKFTISDSQVSLF